MYSGGWAHTRRAWGPVFILCATVLGLCGCGYTMAGKGAIAGGVRNVSVTMFANRTSESGLETVVTNAVITELSRRRKGGAGETDGVLSGVITSLERRTLSRKSGHTPSERRVAVTVLLTLTATDGTQLWKDRAVQIEQAYAVTGGEKMENEGGLRRALGLISNRLAETVARMLVDDF